MSLQTAPIAIIHPDGRRQPEHWPLTVLGRNAIELWEPLRTIAPCPDNARPYCCYWKTVIFYVRPYIVRPWHHLWRDARGHLRADKPGRYYEEWERIETVLYWDLPVEFSGTRFLCGGGTVFWRHRRWWMKRTAWRNR